MLRESWLFKNCSSRNFYQTSELIYYCYPMPDHLFLIYPQFAFSNKVLPTYGIGLVCNYKISAICARVRVGGFLHTHTPHAYVCMIVCICGNLSYKKLVGFYYSTFMRMYVCMHVCWKYKMGKVLLLNIYWDYNFVLFISLHVYWKLSYKMGKVLLLTIYREHNLLDFMMLEFCPSLLHWQIYVQLTNLLSIFT